MIGISFTTFLSSASTLDEMKGSSSAKKKISFLIMFILKIKAKLSYMDTFE